jgi:hypothetical protein
MTKPCRSLSGAPPQVRERDHGDSHADDIDEMSEESKPACQKRSRCNGTLTHLATSIIVNSVMPHEVP